MIIIAAVAFIGLFSAFVILPTQVQKYHERRAETSE
jgi:hypothetical protein